MEIKDSGKQNTVKEAGNSIKISVRNLVEFILRSGDIDNRGGSRSAGTEAMLEGGRIHRMIQKKMGPDYRAEVPLKWTFPMGEFDILVEGRADGIFETARDNESRVTVDEIKGVYAELSSIKEPYEVHLAQAKCYAFIYAKQNGLERIGAQLTYCNMETEEVLRFREEYTRERLEEWFSDMMERYRRWAVFEYEWKKQRQDSIGQTDFPFPYREGQYEMASNVYRTMYHGKKLFLEAPTGSGKTISAIFPAVKAVGRSLGDKIFYLTARTITRMAAENTFGLLRGKGLKFKTLILTAKEKICFQEETECNPEACPYARGHYDRINDAVFHCISSEDEVTRDTVEKYAGEHQVCPFEMSLDLSNLADAVICDYNYVFDPNVRLKRFFSDGVPGDYLFLVDEAHNLVDRGRDMYSASLYKEDFLALKRQVRPYDAKLGRDLEKCNKALLEMKRECGGFQVLSSIGDFAQSAMRLLSRLDAFLENKEQAGPEVMKPALDFYLELRRFLNTYERVDENYVMYAEEAQDGRFRIKQFCIDPSKNLRECLEKGNSTILFSATLLPLSYYFSLLGGDEEDYAVYARSAFDNKRRSLLIGRDVSAKYSRRTELEYYNIACYIHEITEARRGNYMIFFPSHAFLKEVYEIYRDRFSQDGTECIMQTAGMGERQREDFLNRFEGNKTCDIQSVIHMEIEFEEEKSLLGFCVMGGIFAEGIDLKNDSLIGTIIVGTGIPQVCSERELIKRFFDERGENGFDYAYRYPGMNKVLQAAGRVIRTTDDIGVVALLDDRFLSASYQKLFPREWYPFLVCSRKEIGELLRNFWAQWQTGLPEQR